MVSLAMGLQTGLWGPVWVDPGAKVNSEVYQGMLAGHCVGKLCAQVAAGQKVIWQEDNAPSHSSRSTVTWRKSNWPSSVSILQWLREQADAAD